MSAGLGAGGWGLGVCHRLSLLYRKCVVRVHHCIWSASHPQSPVPSPQSPSMLDVLYEDNHLLAVNKPAMLPTMGVAEIGRRCWRWRRSMCGESITSRETFIWGSSAGSMRR